MPYDPERHHRRSIRLRGFDYRTPGLYVVTVCTRTHRHLFGHITDGIMHPNSAGQMIQRTWDEIPNFYPAVDIDAFVVMPNHIHGIVFLVPQESDLCPTSTSQDERPAPPVGAPSRGRPGTPSDDVESPPPPSTDVSDGREFTSEAGVSGRGRPRGGAPTSEVASPDSEADALRLSLSNVMERFKSLTTHRYGHGVRNEGWPPYHRKLWQRDFYDRIVRNDEELNRFRRYIEANPGKWSEDPYRNDD